ncbi:MAG: acyltransferase [Solirubrobacteraceae bacterium]
MERQAKLNVKGTVQLMRGTRVLVAERAVLTIGHGTFINDHSMITCFQRIEIGSGVAIAWHVQILDSDVHQLVVANVARSRTKPVLIADRVWIGTGALVLKGVRIEQDSVVAAGAVISRSVGPGTLVAGNPAQIVRTSVTWSP